MRVSVLHLRFSLLTAFASRLYGVAAFATIWLYRQMMVFLPTASILAVPSALISGFIALAISDGASLRQIVGGNLSFLALGSGSNPWPMLNGWIVAAIALNIAAHFLLLALSPRIRCAAQAGF